MWLLTWLFSAHSLAGDALTFDAVRTVEHGVDAPSLTFRPAVDGAIDVQFDCAGRTWTLARPLSAGMPVTLSLAGIGQGVHQCSGRVKLTTSDGGVGVMPLSLEVASLPLVQWTASMDDVDLEGRGLVTHPSRPMSDALLRVIGATGEVVDEQAGDVSDPDQPRFSWTFGGEVVKLVVEARDAYGFRSQLELSPWHYAIPHEDVVFASGSAEVTSTEAPKLEATWADTVAVMQKYGVIVDIQLYVAGYTDTVGATGSNQALSERRARAIAGWFRQRGVSGAIWYQGFGERALAVPTPDETDEVRNRRAVYLLAAQTPPVDAHLPAAAWKRL